MICSPCRDGADEQTFHWCIDLDPFHLNKEWRMNRWCDCQCRGAIPDKVDPNRIAVPYRPWTADEDSR